MNRAMTIEHLELAEKHVREGEDHIAQQMHLLGHLRLTGADTANAERMLQTLLQSQAPHVEGRDRLRREIEEAK